MGIIRAMRSSGVVGVALASAAASAQTFQVGQMVEGCGFKGKIVEIKPRAGWDVPFYVIRQHTSATYYDVNCTPDAMRAVASAPPATAPADNKQKPEPTPPRPQAAADATGQALCKPGAKLEGHWGNSWYAVTVLGAPGADGKCPVSFDGHGRLWDTTMTMDSIRPSGSGDVYKPTQPVAREPAERAEPAGPLKNGRYTCHKISPGGQLQRIGTLTVSGGRGTLQGLPDGWTATNIEPMANSPRGEPMVAYHYRSSAGWNDKLDCELQ